MEEIRDFLKKCETFYLATTDGHRPHLRPFGAVELYDGRLFLQTGGAKAVAAQLRENPRVEIVGCDGETWLRLGAVVKFCTEDEPRERMLEAYPYLRDAYDGENPMLLLELTELAPVWYAG